MSSTLLEVDGLLEKARILIAKETGGDPASKEYAPDWQIGETRWEGMTRFMCIKSEDCGACCFYYYNRYRKGQECICDVSVFGSCKGEERTDGEGCRWEVVGGEPLAYKGSKLIQGR